MNVPSSSTADTLYRVPAGSLPPGADAPARHADTVLPIDGAAEEVVLMVLIDVAPTSRLWGYARFVLGGWPLRRVPGLRFSRQLGSGYEGGFGLRPSGTRQGLFLIFDDAVSCEAFLQRSPLLAAYRARARELCIVRLRTCSSRGSWGGAQPAVAAAPPRDGPVAALTRASIRPSRALAFWRLAPAAQASLDRAAGCRLAVGLGEAPFLRQATFSLWDSAAAMEAYSRTGAHQQAARASGPGRFFSESMFVRFVPESVCGQWKGKVYG